MPAPFQITQRSFLFPTLWVTFSFSITIHFPNKFETCITGGEASTGGGRIYSGSPPLHPPPPPVPPKRPAAGCGASLCLPCVMRCHLALLALPALWYTSWIWEHLSRVVPPHWTDAESPPVHILMLSSPRLVQCCTEPRPLFAESSHINEAESSVFLTSACGIMKLWSRRGGL